MAKHLVPGATYRYAADHELRIVPQGKVERYLLQPGDILFMSRGAGNYAVLLESFPQPAIAPSTFYVLRARDGVDPAYLAWCLVQQPVMGYLSEIRTGASTPMIPRSEFCALPIPLPPMSVQKRIAQLAALQTKEKALRQQLLDETERLHRLQGQNIFDHLTID
jgi:restriction endonuclease S subunit